MGLAHHEVVNDLANRAEDIAPHLVSYALGAEVKRFDVGQHPRDGSFACVARTCRTDEPVMQS